MYQYCETPKTRKVHMLRTLSKATLFVEVNDQVEIMTNLFLGKGIKPLDALHLSSAEISQADYFCTCDDNFLKKAKKIPDLRVKIVSPINLLEEIEK